MCDQGSGVPHRQVRWGGWEWSGLASEIVCLDALQGGEGLAWATDAQLMVFDRMLDFSMVVAMVKVWLSKCVHSWVLQLDGRTNAAA